MYTDQLFEMVTQSYHSIEYYIKLNCEITINNIKQSLIWHFTPSEISIKNLTYLQFFHCFENAFIVGITQFIPT